MAGGGLFLDKSSRHASSARKPLGGCPAQRKRKENKMVIVNSLDERLLDCAFCGKKFFDTPDMALFGWDDDTPIYACMACDTAQQNAHPTPESLASSQAVVNASAESQSDSESKPAQARVA
jgi:hypothetical protein